MVVFEAPEEAYSSAGRGDKRCLMESMSSQAGDGKSPNHNGEEDASFSTPMKDAAKSVGVDVSFSTPVKDAVKNVGVEAEEDEDAQVVKTTPGAIFLSRYDDIIDHITTGLATSLGSCKKLEPYFTPSFECTACGRDLSESRIYEHPKLLGVGVCSTCYAILSTKKVGSDGWEEQCMWCGRGEKTVNCGQCEKLFCKGCIVRNYSLALICAEDKWSCFCCDPALLSVHIDELQEFRNLKANQSAKIENVKAEVPLGDPTIEEMIKARNLEEERKKHTGIGTKSCSQSSRVKSRVQKRRRASTGEHARQLKRQKGTAKQQIPQEAAPPPPRAYIRPHQMREKRRQAAARREAAIRATERLRRGEPYSSSTEESPIKNNLSTKFSKMSSDSEDL